MPQRQMMLHQGMLDSCPQLVVNAIQDEVVWDDGTLLYST